MGRKYAKVEAGEWVQPTRTGYRMACCDCGLVHVLNFRTLPMGGNRRKIQFQVFRDNRATAGLRRKKKGNRNDESIG